MLSFTARGAVRTPDTLQIRVGPVDGALKTGLPEPSRALEPDEIAANLRAFTTGRDTTRSRPCTRLVISGCGDADLAPAVAFARELGVEHVTLHGTARPDVLGGVDRIAIRAVEPSAILSAPDQVPVTLVVPTVDGVLADLEPLVAAVLARRPESTVFSWPFPGPGVTVSGVDAVLAAVRPAVHVLREAGLDARIGGLPACLGGPEPAHRTRNRFYVDADHQLADALLFFPDVVALAKPDTCRVCAFTAWCDGVARAWLEGGVVGLPEPIASPRGPC
ncbi:MAG: hypothetical protein H6736_02070 [Alphaproteobacteria bacterium]|nr:hypothetical protein [Alphaproteobacteria bacterium]